jgi:hypothetical protein
MSKPLNEFGGWLSFCKLCVILSFILLIKDVVLVSIALVANQFVHFTNISRQDTFSAMIVIFGYVILVFIQIQIIKILKTRAPIISNKLSKLFIVWLVVIIAIWGVFFVMDHFNILPGSFYDKFKIKALAGLIIPLSWLAYFRWSKRVKAYYGANAFEQNPINN